MNDSNEENQSVKDLAQAIGQSLREYFDVRRQRSQNRLDLANQQTALVAEFEKIDKPLGEREDALASKIRQQVIPNKVLLLSGKLKSFATTYGSVSFKKKAETTKIVDAAGFENQARRDGNLKRLGKFVRTWKPDIKAVAAWLKSNPDEAKRYEPFIERGGDFDELLVQSNAAYIKEFDPNRLTEKAINLGPVDDKVEDEASDDTAT